jgi:hypothetical protein
MSETSDRICARSLRRVDLVETPVPVVLVWSLPIPVYLAPDGTCYCPFDEPCPDDQGS